jgi:threonine aldolase
VLIAIEGAFHPGTFAMNTIDLRSDTVTRPTAEMRDAMMKAALGDDVFGDDPTVNHLQEKLADLLGFEAALFMPTGTMSNFCGILAHCQRGDEYIVGQYAHTYRWEGGGAAVLGSVQPQPLEHAPDGSLPVEAIEAAIKPDDPHFARTRLLALENTIGGKLLPFEYLVSATKRAKAHRLATHLDGARLFNAAVAQAALTGGKALTEAHRIAQLFDSVSICFSKGLGTPAGSALCGSRDLIKKALRLRKMSGGGMRQVGMLAGAAIHALDHHVERLAEDHRLAKTLAKAFDGIDGVKTDLVHSNIVFVDFDGAARKKADGFLDHLKNNGVLATGLYRTRFVTHLDVNEAAVMRAANVIRDYLAA